MDALDNGSCPHCGRSDAVKEIASLHVTDECRERSAIDVDAAARRFHCGGCNAMWSGVRHAVRSVV